MKVLRYLVILSAILLAVGCAKEEVKEEKQVKINKLYTIEGFPEGADSTRTFSFTWNGTKIDNAGNVFVRDVKSGSIRVFDNEGNFKNNITNTGMGPEEIETFNVFYFDKDTLCILDSRIKLKKFLKDGKYMSSKILKFEDITLPAEIYELNDSTLIMRLTTYKKVENGILLGQILSLNDKSLNRRKVIYESYLNYPKEGKQILLKEPIFAFNENSVYVTTRNKSEYKVDVFSNTGNFRSKINKNYTRTKFSQKELDMLVADGLNSEELDEIYDFKLSIFDLSTDKFGNLWVQRASGYFGDDIAYDIIKDDQIIAQFKIENTEETKTEMKIITDKYLYILDYSNDTIEVYGYEFE
jgi:hypothetical protein